jgi:hypothetical protein
MTAKKTKEERDTEEDSRLEKIFKGAERVVRGLKMPGFGDWVTVTVIGKLENPLARPMYGVPDDSHALPPEAEAEPDFVMCKPFRCCFRAGEVSDLIEEEKGVAVFRHTMGANGRILVRESWDEMCALLGITPVFIGDVAIADISGADPVVT